MRRAGARLVLSSQPRVRGAELRRRALPQRDGAAQLGKEEFRAVSKALDSGLTQHFEHKVLATTATLRSPSLKAASRYEQLLSRGVVGQP